MGVGSGLAIAAGIGAAGSIGGAAIGSAGANSAASKQEQAAEQAAQLQYQASQNSLGFQEGQYANSQQELAPWLQSGAEATSSLDYLLGLQQPGSLGQNASQQLGSGQYAAGTAQYPGLQQPNGSPQQPARPGAQVAGASGASGAQPMTGPGGQTGSGLQLFNGANGQTGAGTPGVPSPISTAASPNTALGGFGSLMQPYGQTFSAPTLQQAEQAPGYQFQLQQGNQLLQQSAAAQGNLLTGGTAEALQNYGQGLAQTDYNNVYNQAFNTFSQNYNQYEQQQTNQYNRLASLAGIGQQTAGQLGTLGQNASNSITSNLLGTAGAIGQQYNNAAAANASGIVGSANAWGGALSGTSNNLSQLALLQQLQGGGGDGVDWSQVGSGGYG